MKKALMAALACAVLGSTSLALAQEPQVYGNVIVSNRPHKQTTAVKPPTQSAAQEATQPPKQTTAIKAQTVEKNTQAAKQNTKAEKKKAKSAKSKQTKTSAAKTDKNEKLTVQQSNWRLKVAQQKLKVLGFSEEKPSGKMTQATTTALKSFQKQHSLKAHGELDDATYHKLTWEAFSKEGIQKLQGKEVVAKAAQYKGVPYVFGGTTPKGFDCSGYVQYVFKDCKASLPRLADEQALKGVFVTQRQLRPGDLVFFTTYLPGASHVGIYAGSGKFWSASSSRGVVLSSLQDDYWKSRYYGARRVLVANGEV